MSETASKNTAKEGTMSQASAARPHSRTDAAEMSAEELLAIPPQADHLAEELAARPPRAKLPRVTLALGGAVLIAAGFIGGVVAQKHYGGTSAGSTASRASSFASAFARAGGAGRTGTGTGGFGGAGGFGGGGSISGTVTVVSGDTLYVTGTNGTVYTVKTSGSTTVSIAASGTLSQLKPGQTVTIAGSADSSGNVTATSITAAN